MISPHTIGWLGWAGRFCCCSHLRSAICDHNEMVMGLHSQVLCLRGSGRSLASARAPPCRSRTSPSLPTISSRPLNFPESCSRLPNHTTAVNHFCLVTGSLRETVNQCSGGQYKDIDFRDLVPLWRLATTSSNIKLNTLIFCTGKNLNGGSTPNSNVGRSSFLYHHAMLKTPM